MRVCRAPGYKLLVSAWSLIDIGDFIQTAIAVSPLEPIAKRRLKWSHVLWIAFVQIGVVLAPFTFSWSGLTICVALYFLVGFGITIGFHRLLTHRSFRAPLSVERLFAVLGTLANQGGPLQWVAIHRIHHRHSDEAGDPHSPRDGILWAHTLWWMFDTPTLNDPLCYRRYVPDLTRDPVMRSLQRYHGVLPPAFAGVLFLLGSAVGGWALGLSWMVWGIFVRTTVIFHGTWLVNSAAHRWGYRNHDTADDSKNLWWVSVISMGEGWHNNHHAHPRSARHGMRWWEIDVTYLIIRLMGLLGLAKHIHVPGAILRRQVNRASSPGDLVYSATARVSAPVS